MQEQKKQKSPDAPGVFFTGETQSGFAKWTVQGNYNGAVNQDVLQHFNGWKQFANVPQALQILLKLYFDDLGNGGIERSEEETDELSLFFGFMAAMAANDFTRTQTQLDDMIEEQYGSK